MKKIAFIIILLFTIYIIYSTIAIYWNCQVSLKYEEAIADEIKYVMNYSILVFIYIISIIAFYLLNKLYKVK